MLNRVARLAEIKRLKKPEDIARLMRDECLDASSRTAKAYHIIVAFLLHHKLGFGQERVDRFLNDIIDLFDSIDKGFLTIEDIQQTLKDEINITIK